MRKLVRIIYIFIIIVVLLVIIFILKISKKEVIVEDNVEITQDLINETTILSKKDDFNELMEVYYTIQHIFNKDVPLNKLKVSDKFKSKYDENYVFFQNYVYETLRVSSFGNYPADKAYVEFTNGYAIDYVDFYFVLNNKGELDDITFGEVYHYIDENGKLIHHPKIMDEEHYKKNIWIICHDEGAEFMDGEDNTWDEVALSEHFKSKYTMYESVLPDDTYIDFDYYDGTDYTQKRVVLKATYSDREVIYSIKYEVDEMLNLYDIKIERIE